MHTLIDVQKRVYIRQNRNIGDISSLDDNSVEAAKKTIGRYWNEIVKAMGIKDKIRLLKNKRNEYCFTDEGAKLLEEVLYLYSLSKAEKDSIAKTKKNLLTRILGYKDYDAFVLEDNLRLYEEYIETNNIVVKLVECFYKLFQDAGVPDKDIKNILWEAAMKFRYSERKCYMELFMLMKDNIRKFIEINQENNTNDISHTENAIWMSYATKKIEETMKEVFDIRDKMSEIRSDEIEKESSSRYKAIKDEVVERYRGKEDAIYEICNKDEEVNGICEEYKKQFKVKLDIGKMLVILLMGKDTELVEQHQKFFEAELVRLSEKEKRYIKYDKERSEKLIEKLRNRILVIIEEYLNRDDEKDYIFLDDDVIKIRNKELLDSAIKAYEENTKVEKQ